VIAHLDPPDVLCLGQTSSVDVLQAAAERAGRSPTIHHLDAPLSELRVRFRELLTEILRVWSTRVMAGEPVAV
jgi:hypothetical protein